MASLRSASPRQPLGTTVVSLVRWAIPWLVLGALLVVLVYQVPVRQDLAIGYNDAGYVQAFADATNRWGVVTDTTDTPTPYRWSGTSSVLLFPQIGLPAQITIRLRGWRPVGEPVPQVRVLLNGRTELGTVATSNEWQEVSFPINSGLLKPQDVFVQLDTDALLLDGVTARGVQVERAVFMTAGWPIVPYPAQIAGGAFATLLVAALVRRPRWTVGIACVLALGFLLLYRLAILPFAVRPYWLLVCGALGIGLVMQAVAHPELAAELRTRLKARWVDMLALASVALWTALLARMARTHVVLSLPGVEKDFRVFATRSEAWWCPAGAFDGTANCVWRADGFYQLGYPAVVWALRSVTDDNAFIAAQIVAIVSGAILLGATYLLARSMLGLIPALLALLIVAFNRWTTSYALYLGTDMPFAAACAVTLLALLLMRDRPARIFAAGVACGGAFLIRHPGIVLVALGCVWLWLDRRAASPPTLRRWLAWCGLLVAGFVLASLPQIVVNLVDTGTPLYSQQAKNIWLAVYGNTDWSRWTEARDSIGLSDVVLHDPARFIANWWGNLRAFLGSGGEDTSEFGRSLGLRLLTFPANLLALVGVVLWVGDGDRTRRWLIVVVISLHRRHFRRVHVAAILLAASARRCARCRGCPAPCLPSSVTRALSTGETGRCRRLLTYADAPRGIDWSG